MENNKLIEKYVKRIMVDYPEEDKIYLDFIQFANEIQQVKNLNIPAVSGSYVVFEDSHEHEALIQLSVPLPTLERAREYVKAWKSKKLYIYLLVE